MKYILRKPENRPELQIIKAAMAKVIKEQERRDK
jgi:hypothetical protein